MSKVSKRTTKEFCAWLHEHGNEGVMVRKKEGGAPFLIAAGENAPFMYNTYKLLSNAGQYVVRDGKRITLTEEGKALAERYTKEM